MGTLSCDELNGVKVVTDNVNNLTFSCIYAIKTALRTTWHTNLFALHISKDDLSLTSHK